MERIQFSSFWKYPNTLLQDKKDKRFLVFFFTVYVPLFLLVFQPFGVNNYDPTHQIRYELVLGSLIFGLVCGATLILFEFLIAPFFFSKTTGGVFVLRLILELILVASTIFLFYNIIGNFHDWKWTSFIAFVRDSTLMSILPMIIVLLYLTYRNTDRENEILKIQKPSGGILDEPLLLQSSNGKERLIILLASLLFIESEQNYVSVHYMDNELIKKTLLRTTMKKLEEELRPFSIVRSHRSFLVNMHNVIKARGNSHQMLLYLSKNNTPPIPVSRSYISNFRDYLDSYPK
ncbi:MAG: LytTR family DNA-binding domain-containing protein [Bacteroidota bacterium]